MLKEVAVEMTEKLKQLGPSPFRNIGQMAI